MKGKMFKSIKYTLFPTIVLMSLLITACDAKSTAKATQELDKTQTAITETVSAQDAAKGANTSTPAASIVTQTPLLFSSLPLTPLAPPASLTLPSDTTKSECASASLISETIPDDTIFKPRAKFTKTWKVKNTSTCSWGTTYKIAFWEGEVLGGAVGFLDGNSMNGPSTQALIGRVAPGQTIDISVNLTAPRSAGDYKGIWKIRDASGILFGNFHVQIKVQNPATVTPVTVTATSTLPPAAVTNVSYTAFTVTNGAYVNCPIITANITTSGAGDITYHWIDSLGIAASNVTLHFDSAGTKKSVANVWYVSPLAPGPLWVSIYIDTPNHQEFSHHTVLACTGYP